MYYLLGVLVISIFILIVGAPILKPLVFALVLAIMFSPLQSFYNQFIRFPLLSILFTLLTVFVPISLVISFFIIQSRTIFSSTDSMIETVEEGLRNVIELINKNTPFSFQNIDDLTTVSQPVIDFLSSGVSTTINTLALSFLALIFLVFFMWYRSPLVKFLILQFSDEKKEQVEQAIVHTKQMLVKYLFGMATVMVIMATLNSIGLTLIGLDHAVFFGVLAAMLTLIPYLGTTIGGFLPFIYAIALGNWWQALAVVIFYFTIQQIEGNFITPKIVGDSVRINPFVAILGLSIGAILWGVAGIVLAIPILGLIRIIFFEIHALRPIALIMGNDITSAKLNMNEYDDEKFRIRSLFLRKK